MCKMMKLQIEYLLLRGGMRGEVMEVCLSI